MKMYHMDGRYNSGIVVIANNPKEAVKFIREMDHCIANAMTDEQLENALNEREIVLGAIVMFYGDI